MDLVGVCGRVLEATGWAVGNGVVFLLLIAVVTMDDANAIPGIYDVLFRLC